MEAETKKNSHGGAREGAGRKRNPDRGITVTFRTSALAMEKLNALCELKRLSRNEVLTRILESLD